MADVKINIPGIGEVVASNAASEETMLKILAVMDKTTKKQQDPSQGIFKNMVKDYQSQKKAADEYEKSLEGLTKEQKKALASEREVALSQLKFERALLGGVQAVSAITGTIGSLGKSVLSLGVQMATSYDEMAKNPIGAAAGQVNTFIDMANTAVKGVADASAGVAHAFGGIPIVGPIISGLGDAAAAATKGLADLAAAVLHTANDVMAKEFQKSATALDVYTKQGASFANGMVEMRTIANDAGLSLTLLQDAAKNSRQELRESGLSQGDAVKVLAKGMLSAKDTIGKSGASLRNEMLALGYNYQEQGEIMAQYMAQQRSAGENLKNIAPAELARGAREYAQNLKIISDITGEDAKKLMEKAKAQAMEADLMAEAYAKGGPEAVKKLQAQLATMPEAMKKGYMEFVSTGGTAIADAATNVAITQNPKIMEQYRQQYETLGDANKKQQDALIESGKLTEQTGKYAREHLEDTRTLAMAGRLSGDGQLQAVSTLNNSLIMAGAKLEEGTTQASKDASDAQAKLAASANSLESNFASITKTMQDNAVRMEELAGEHLEEYGEVLKRTADATAEAFDKAIKFINSGFDVASLTAKPGDAENKARMSEAKNNYDKEFAGAGFFQKFFQIGMTESQRKANANLNDAGTANMQHNDTDYFSSIPHLDGGGVVSGPSSGYLAMLHGTEKVEKLGSKEDLAEADTLKGTLKGLLAGAYGDASRSSMDRLVDLVERQLEQQQEMIMQLRDHKDIAQKQLYASY